MKTKRSHKKMDNDVKQLMAASRAIERTSPRMRVPTLEFLMGHYVALAKLNRE
jgi:hypothetical protein